MKRFLILVLLGLTFSMITGKAAKAELNASSYGGGACGRALADSSMAYINGDDNASDLEDYANFVCDTSY